MREILKRYTLFLIIFCEVFLISCNEKHSNEDFKNDTIKFENLIGEWYLMETITNGKNDSHFYKHGVKWKIFSDSSLLISQIPYYSQGIYDQFSRYIPNTNPGSINLFKVQLKSDSDTISLLQKNEYNENYIDKFDNSYKTDSTFGYIEGESIESRKKREEKERESNNIEKERVEKWNNQFKEVGRDRIVFFSKNKLVLKLINEKYSYILIFKK